MKLVRFSTGDKIPASEKLLEDIPLVGELSFSEFEEVKGEIKGKPIVCSNCGAILTSLESVQTDPKVGMFFKCNYCSTINVIDPKDLPTKIDPYAGWFIPPEKPTQDFGDGVQKGNSLIAVLDVSGSMSGAKLAGVKKSLISTLKSYSKSNAKAIFGLITFESQVRIYSPDGEVVEKISGDDLYDLKAIEQQIAKNAWIKNQLPKIQIGKTMGLWEKTVRQMESLNSTALGPAVVAARVMSLHVGTGRILLLTDGMANEGIGSLSSASPEGKQFYRKIAEELSKNGIILDIVGIAGEGSLELKTLAQLPEITGGDLFYVDLSELEDSFSLLAGDQLIGRRARIKVIVPQELELMHVSGMGTRTKKVNPGEDIAIGGLSRSRSISFELKPKKDIKKRKKVPVQIQIQYQDENDNKRIRVIEKELEVTELKEELEKSLDADLIAGYTVQRAAQVMQSDRKRGKELMKTMQAKLKKAAPKAVAAQQYLEEEIEELDEIMLAEKRGMTQAADKIQANAYRMVKKRKK